MNQQKLREWILKQKYFFLNPELDGMTAWELAGIIIREGRDETTEELRESLEGEQIRQLGRGNFIKNMKIQSLEDFRKENPTLSEEESLKKWNDFVDEMILQVRVGK